MTKPDDKPEAPKSPPIPRMTSIAFADPLTLTGVTPKDRLDLLDRDKSFDILVQGASVFVRRPDGMVVEVPRSQCTIRWDCEGYKTIDEAVRAIGARK